MTAKVHSLLTAVAVLAFATGALAGQAKPAAKAPAKPAAKAPAKPAAAAPAAAPAAPAAPAKFVPPIRGEAPVQMTKPVVKRTGNEVVENFKVKNASAARDNFHSVASLADFVRYRLADQQQAPV